MKSSQRIPPKKTKTTPPADSIGPKSKPQTAFLSSRADIVVYGGAAGGGKSYSLLLEACRHIKNPLFGAVIFRRRAKDIKSERGLWDESETIYPHIGGKGFRPPTLWKFPSGAKIKFDHLRHEKDKITWQGAGIALIGFDELTHFSESQFFYLFSRNRSISGIKPYIRATTNPDANSWVKRLLAPWVDDTFLNPADSGELRWFVREDDKLRWCDKDTPDAKSITFVKASIYDNKILLQKDPSYLSNLKALPRVDRLRLLHGDWNVVETGNMFWREWFGEPWSKYSAGLRLVRYWDLASSEVKEGRDPDWTAGVLMGIDDDTGMYWILDIQADRKTPGGVEKLIRQTAIADRALYGDVSIWIEQEPGSSGVAVIDHYIRNILPEFSVRGDRVSGRQVERVKPLSGATEKRRVRLIEGEWNHAFLAEATAYPGSGHDDRVVAASGAFNILTLGPNPGVPIGGGRAQEILIGQPSIFAQHETGSRRII